tara:strand:- start:2411 stop:2866 length:456 start_codon:yes stop_codon:yes gene_type:complete
MYAIEINEEIKVYNELPKSWGNVIGGFNTLSAEEAEAYGFYTVVKPEYDSSTQNLGSIYFDTNNFTYEVNDIEFVETLEELKENKIKALREYTNYKLSNTDWYVTRKFERSIDIPESIQSERSEILNHHNTKESEINELTTKGSVVSYEFE